MKRHWLLGVLAALVLSLVTAEVEAKRMGGGRAIGRQQPQVMERQSVAPAPAPGAAGPNAAAAQAAPAQAARPAPAAVPAGTQAAPVRSRWLAPLAGIAAGLGLAALASHLGLSEAFGSVLLILLGVIALMVVVRMLRARGAGSARPVSRTNPYQPAFSYHGVGQEAAVPDFTPPAGNAGRPAVDVIRPSSGLDEDNSPSTAWRVPDDFDRDAFLRNAKSQYVRLQAAYDAARMDELREFTTTEMFSALSDEIGARRGAANRTDVVTLNAELLGISSNPSEHVASVRFHGMLRESDQAAAVPFDEVWNLLKPADGSSGWVLAGIQPLS